MPLKMSATSRFSTCFLRCVCYILDFLLLLQVFCYIKDFHLQFNMCLLPSGFAPAVYNVSVPCWLPPTVCNVSPMCWISTCSLQCVACLLDLPHLRAKFLSMSDFHLQFMLYESYKLNFHFTSSVCLLLVAWHLPFTMDLLHVGCPPAFCDVSTTYSLSTCRVQKRVGFWPPN